MSETVAKFNDRKLADYISPGGKYLIVFHHGLGDAVMFVPAYRYLCDRFPESLIDLDLHKGQGAILPHTTIQGKFYDAVFSLSFYMEPAGKTKLQMCCEAELGVPYEDVKKFGGLSFDRTDNPFVLCHFFSTCMPEQLGWPEQAAKKVWDEIISCGKVPVDCDMRHTATRNRRFQFVTRTCDDLPADASVLLAMMQHCHAFVGVVSGPLHLALACRVPSLCLENRQPITRLYDKALPAVQLETYKDGAVAEWLGGLDSHGAY